MIRLFTGILLLLCLMLIGMGSYLAHAYQYHPALGTPLAFFGTVPLYAPWKPVQWWMQYGSRDAALYQHSGRITLVVTLLAVSLIFSVGKQWKRPGLSVHGSAVWGTRRDIRAMGLFARCGFVLARSGWRILRDNGEGHLLVVAPPRSGKGVGLILPTLLSLRSNVVVYDIKGENHQRSFRWRARFSTVYRFDVTDPASAHYNPLLGIRLGVHEVRDAQELGHIVVDPDESAKGEEVFWTVQAINVFVASALYLLYCDARPSMSRMITLWTTEYSTHQDVLLTLSTCGHAVVESLAQQAMKNASEKTLSSIVETMLSRLWLYRDPIIAELTSRSDFSMAMVREDTPFSLYLVVPPADLARTRPLIRMMLTQLLHQCTDRAEPLQKPCAFILDEYHALGHFPALDDALAHLPGYNVRAMLVLQSLDQCHNVSAMLDVCTTQVYFSQSSTKSRREVSALAGTETVEVATQTKRREILEWWIDQRYNRTSPTGRPLLLPDEVGRLGKKNLLILQTDAPPIRAKKLRYYRSFTYWRRAS